MKVIVGNISFEDDNKKAIVHNIAAIIDCSDHNHPELEPEELAVQIGQDLVNSFGAYIVPEIWDGEIIYECNMSIDVHNSDEWEEE